MKRTMQMASAVALQIILAVTFFSLPAKADGQAVTTPKRQGSFKVVGKLVDEKGNPISGWTVAILMVNKERGIVIRAGNDGKILLHAGEGVTNEVGLFRIVVKKNFFDSEKIRFCLETWRGENVSLPGNPNRRIEMKGGGLAVFEVEEDIKELDLTRHFDGAISIRQ